MVICRPPLGAGAESEPLPRTCKSLPMVVAAIPIVICGCVTVAVRVVFVVGVLNPVTLGVPRLRIVLPSDRARKVTVFRLAESPGCSTAGLLLMVPTLVSLLIMGTFTVRPPRIWPALIGTNCEVNSITMALTWGAGAMVLVEKL